MTNRTILLLALVMCGFVVLPGFSVSDDGSPETTMGCGKSPLPGKWLDGDNVAHIYFSQVDPTFDGKNDKEAWGKMSYTFCGEPTHFVFNGHGLEREMPYALIASPSLPGPTATPAPIPALLGDGMTNNGGNVHIKGAFPPDEIAWDLYLVRGDNWEEIILAGDAPAAYTSVCGSDSVCERGILYAPLSGEMEVPPVATDAAGQTVFYENGSGDTLAYILQASVIGTVVAAHIHYGAMDTVGPAVATLFAGSDSTGDLLVAGTIMEAALMGDFAGSPVSALVAAMDAGMTYVNVHTEAWPAGEIRGQVERLDIGALCRDCDRWPEGEDCNGEAPGDPYPDIQ